MLRVGLTGGIAAGKSLASARFAELGAVIIDADKIAREVVAPGTPGLAQIAERFGSDLITADGSLDRPRLGEIIFADSAARQALERITHPLIRESTVAQIDQAAEDAVVVHDVPLLVEKNMGPDNHLNVVVGADAERRVQRMVSDRGMTEKAARQRINAQATDQQRRASADVWLDNNGTPDQLRAAVDALWHDRLVPFEHNVRAGVLVRRSEELHVVPPNPTWPAQGARLVARLRRVFGNLAVAVEHIGSTAIPGMPAKDVIDLQVGVHDLSDLDRPEVRERITDGGFPRMDGEFWDHAHDANGASRARKFLYGGADPARVVHVHAREVDSPAWRLALLFRAWITTEAAAHRDYRELKRRLSQEGLSTSEYAVAKEPWFADAIGRAEEWAQRTGWTLRS